MKVSACFLGVALATTFSFTAFADSAPSPDSSQSEHLANQAYEAYSNGDYAKAVLLYTNAYDASPAGVIIFNIANIYDKKLKHRQLAIEHYRRYLQSPDTTAELVERANTRITTLRNEIDAEAAATRASGASPGAASPAVGAPRPHSSETQDGVESPWRTVGWIVGGAGLVGLGIGSAFGLAAKGKADEADRLCSGATCADPRGLTLTNDARSAATVSTVGFVAGGALFATGLALVLFAPSSKRVAALRVSPIAVASGGGLSFGRTW